MTAEMVLALADQGKLSLDATLGKLFSEESPSDRRFASITITDLLRHSAGWDSELTFEPILDASAAQRELGLAPEDCVPIAAAMLAKPLQFDPGTRYAYSNLGYCWLGRAIERTTGMSYATAMSNWLSQRIGNNAFRIGFGDTPREKRAMAYGVGGKGEWAAVEWSDRHLSVLGAAGGWTGTVSDYFRFASLPVDPRQINRPPYAKEEEHFYGLGWGVWPGEKGSLLTHFGSMPGAYSLVLRTPDGHVAVLLFNGRPRDDWQALHWLIVRSGLVAALARE
jgi:N-acyl-D-amino-acid deacylase